MIRVLPPARAVPAATAFSISACLAVSTLTAACVPEGPPTGDRGAPAQRTAAPPATPARAKALPPAAASSRPLITTPFEDTFDRVDLGPDWHAAGPAWKIVGGRLCARGARNKGIWLLRKLPVNARVEFDAYSESADGDLKAELWGDGVSGATGTSYNNATSYILILGGWKNTKHVLARLNEHGDDRMEIDVDANSDDERMRAVSPGQPYHFKIERSDGKKIEWSVNGAVYFERVDAEPLAGAGHEHLGFNDWDAPVCFDNVKVTPL